MVARDAFRGRVGPDAGLVATNGPVSSADRSKQATPPVVSEPASAAAETKAPNIIPPTATATATATPTPTPTSANAALSASLDTSQSGAADESSTEGPAMKPLCWQLGGVPLRDFSVTLDTSNRVDGVASAMISTPSHEDGQASLYQTTLAGRMAGKRVEFSAELRTRGARTGARLWLRGNDAEGKTVAFDNMYWQYGPTGVQVKAGVFGDSEWKTARIVLDIPRSEGRYLRRVLSRRRRHGGCMDGQCAAARRRQCSPVDDSSRRINHSPDDGDGSRIVGIVEKPQNLGLDDADEDGTSCKFLADSP